MSIVKRKTKYTLLSKVDNKKAQNVTSSTIDILKPYSSNVHTITSDNGKEFAGHEKISESVNAQVYFAHPYHAWERGLNENTNGLIRQYFPKTTDFRSVTNEQINTVMDKINNRPRKTLKFKTPEEILSESTNKES